MSSIIYRVQNNTIARQLFTLNDKNRNSFYFNIISTHAKNKVVLDIGSGTGLLAYFALASGAEFVYCIEKNVLLSSICEKILGMNFESHRFRVITGDFFNPEVQSQIQHPISMFVCDTTLPGVFNHTLIESWKIKNILSDDCVSVPNRIFCDIKVWNSHVKSLSENNSTLLDFYTMSVLDEKFANSLIAIDQTIKIQNNDLSNLTQISPVISKADYFFPCVVDYCSSQTTVDEEICFEISIDKPSTVSIQTNLAFNHLKLYDNDNWKTQYQQGKLFNLSNAGYYNIKYDKTLNDWFVS